MSEFLRRTPFLRLSLLFVGGLILSDHIPQLGPIFWGRLVLGIFVLLLITNLIFFAKPSVLGIGYFLALLCVGGLHQSLHNPKYQARHYMHHLSSENDLVVKINQIKKSAFLANVMNLNGVGSMKGKILLRVDSTLIKRDDLRHNIIFLKGLKIDSIPGPNNPNAFDFARYYKSKGIFHQAYISNSSVLHLSENRQNFLSRIEYLQNKIKEILQTVYSTRNEYSLAQSLLLGDRRYLGEDLRNAYADTGSIHVLAVSGLHVGVIFMILQFLLRWIPRNKKLYNFIRTVLVLGGIWFFALLTGASSSVVRAAIMFSLFEIGVAVSGRSYGLNTLSLAGMIILITDPYSLMDVGFQLSFLAVAGIILVQRRIESLWIIEHKIGHYLWSLISVSLAAQLFTFPVTTYYFHQFPLYFWLSGILTIPLVFIFLWVGFLFLATAWIPVIGFGIGKIGYAIGWLMNSLVFGLQNAPFIKIEGIWIDPPSMVIYFFLILSITFYLHLGHKLIYYPLIMVIIMLTYNNFQLYNSLNQSKLNCYYLRNNSCVDFILNREYFSIYARSIDPNTSRYQLQNAREKLEVRFNSNAKNEFPIYSRSGFYKFQGLSILNLAEFEGATISLPVVDILWINRKIELNEILYHDKWEQSTILIDGNIPWDEGYDLEKSLKAKGFAVFNLHRQGAYQLDLTSL